MGLLKRLNFWGVSFVAIYCIIVSLFQIKENKVSLVAIDRMSHVAIDRISLIKQMMFLYIPTSLFK